MHTQAPPNRLRELLGETNTPLMKVAAECGVYPSTVSRWCDGTIPREKLPIVARVLGVSPMYLDGWLDDGGPVAA